MMRSVCTTLALLATAALSAADFTGGAQVGLSFPQSNLKTVTNTTTSGYGFLFGRCDLGNGHTLRAKLDFASPSGSQVRTGTILGVPLAVNLNTRLTTVALSVDYLYYFQGNAAQGSYAGAGLGVARNSYKLEIPSVTVNGTPIPFAGSETENGTGAVAGIYAGYQFNRNWNAELGYRSTQFNHSDQFNDNQTLPMVTLTAGYTF